MVELARRIRRSRARLCGLALAGGLRRQKFERGIEEARVAEKPTSIDDRAMHRSVTLTYSSRPLRLAYVVSDRGALRDAVRLYTHTWGGAGNAVLPMPRNGREAALFTDTLTNFNPDWVLWSKQLEPNALMEKALAGLPYDRRAIEPKELSGAR